MEVVTTICFGIGAFLMFWVVFVMINNISTYFKMRALYIAKEIDGKNTKALDQLEFSLSIMDLIDRLVHIEVEKKLAQLDQLNVKYRVENFDIDIKFISDTVYKAIRPEVFTSPDMLVNSKYLMETIVQRTSYILIEAGRQYNANYIPTVPSPNDN